MTIKLNLMRNGKVKKTYESTNKNAHAEEVAFYMEAPGRSKAKVIKEDLLKSGNLESPIPMGLQPIADQDTGGVTAPLRRRAGEDFRTVGGGGTANGLASASN